MTFTFRIVVGVAVALLLFGAPGIAAADEVDHKHPDEVDESRNLESIERWLSNEISKRHVNCSDGLSVGNFDACEDLDEEYESLLSEYVSVERELEGNTTTAEQFNETRTEQREYARLLNEFNATYREYENARQAGDERRARELARELQALAARIEELGGELNVQFRELDSEAEGNLSRAPESINQSTSEVHRVTAQIESESFEATRIDAEAEPWAMYGSPATISGTVVDENGSSLLSGHVVVDDGEQTFTTRLDWNREFEIDYRPAAVQQGETELDIRYVPEDTGSYLRSNTTVTTTVAGTSSSVEGSAATESIAFGEDLVITGVVQANEDGVGNLPVTITADDVVLNTTETTEDGMFRTNSTVPANVSTGVTEFTITASAPGRAIFPSETTTLVRVEETPSNLRVTATEGEGAIAITGRLTTHRDVPVGERPVAVTVGETTYSVTTDADGYYSLTHDPDDEVTATIVTAEYDEADSNLSPSTAETSLKDEGILAALLTALTIGTDTLADIIRANPYIAGVIVVGALLNLGIWGMALLARRRSRAASTTETQPEEASTPAASDAGTTTPSTDILLDAARTQVRTNPEAAVRAGYAAVRSELDGNRAAQTHWEFYRAIRPELPDDRDTSLRSITESFERATFASEGIDPETAKGALEDAERCLIET